MKRAPKKFKSHLKKLLSKVSPRHSEKSALVLIATRLEKKEDPWSLWREVTVSDTDRGFLLRVATEIAKYSVEVGITLARDRAIQPDVHFFTALLSSCRAEKEIDMCLQEISLLGIKADMVWTNAVIKAFGNVSCLQRAFSTFSESKHVDKVTLHVLIGACAKNGSEEKAMTAYKLGLRKGIKPDAETIGILIDTAYRVENFQNAWILWNMYKRHGSLPDMDGAMVQLHLSAWYLDDAKSRCFKPSKDEIFQRIEEAVNVVTDPRYIHSTKGAWLVRMLLSKKIIALAKLGRIEDTFLVMQRHTRKRPRFPLDILVVNTFLSRVANMVKSLALAQKAINLIRSLNIKPDAFTLSAMMTAYGDAGHTKEAEEAFENITKEGCFVPSAICYASLITACGKNRDLERALRAFKKAKDAGVVSTEVRSAIMEAHVRAGLAEKAFSFDDPWAQPDLRVFNSLIDACAQFRDMARAWEYFGNMIDARIAPDLRTLHTLLECKRSQLSKDVCPSVDEILHACRNVDFTFQTYFLLLELALEPWRKEAIREEMRTRGFLRQHIAFATFFIGGSILKVVNGPVQRGEFTHVDKDFCGDVLREIEVATGWVEEQSEEARFHAEKKAFCYLHHILGKDEQLPVIQLSLRMCLDCHQFFKHAATWAKKRIVIHDISRVHVFTPNNECSCGEGFKPWVRSEKVSK